jgi:hypothetical protein
MNKKWNCKKCGACMRHYPGHMRRTMVCVGCKK